MQIDWIHPPDTLNLCFNALDRHVIRGRADEPALAAERPTSYARLLEEPVEDEETVVVPGGVVRRGGASSPDDLDWDVALRAGRTDPAPCAEVAASAPALVADGRTLSTTEILERSTGWPYAALATLLGGGTVELGA